MLTRQLQGSSPRAQHHFLTVARVFAGAICLASVSAMAQWTWMDKDGRKVYSDKAPPPDVLEKNILKRPGGQPKGSPATTAGNTAAKGPDAAAGAAAGGAAGATADIAPDGAPPVLNGATAPAAPAATASVPKLTGLEKELEQKKKQAADAVAAKKAEEEQKSAKIKIENCARAKTAKTTLDSGGRIGVTNAKGEREIMDDAARAAETKRVQGMIDASCK